MNFNCDICYVLDALLRTEWRARGTSAALRFYPVVDANGPRCLLANQPYHSSPDPIRSMTVNASNGAILYECGDRTFAHRPRETVSDEIVLGVLALVVDHPWESDPVEDWGIVTERRIISVAGPGDLILQMIPANMFQRRFGSDRDTGSDCYPPATEATAATRQLPVVIDGQDGPHRIMRGHLDRSATLPEEAANAARNPARVVERAELPVSAATPEIAPAVAPAVAPTPPDVPVDAVHTDGLTDRLSGMCPYYVLGLLMGTQWDGTPETKPDGTTWRPTIDVFFEPRIREDGSMVYPVNRAAVSMIEPGIRVHVYADHVEVNGPDFVQATSYWGLPESGRSPLGAVILWCRNWHEDPNATSPLFLAYPIYNIGELEIDGEIVPMIPADDLEFCFKPWGTLDRELSFGDLVPTEDDSAPACLPYLARLAGREILVQAPMCLDDLDTLGDLTYLPHRVTLTDTDSGRLIRDALRANPILMTIGRRPPIPSRVPGTATQTQEPAPTAPDEPEARMAPGGVEATGQLFPLDDYVAAQPAQTMGSPEAGSGGTPSTTRDTVRQLIDVLAENLRTVANALDAIRRTLPTED